MTNETAPKRILVETGVHSDRVCEHGEYDGTRYIRADISEIRTERVIAELEAAQARIAELEDALRRIDEASNHYAMITTYSEGTLRYAHKSTRNLARAALEGKG